MIRLQVLMADLVDTLQSGKQVVHGLYPDRVMILNMPADAPVPSADMRVVATMAFLVTLTGLEAGSHTLAIRFLHGDRSAAHSEKPPMDVVVAPAAACNVAIAQVGLPMKAFGQHFIEVVVDGTHTLTESFEVRSGTALEPQ